MYSTSSLVSSGLVLTVCLLKLSRALPVQTSSLAPVPRRFIEPPYEKDGFSPDYQDIPKKTLAQQAHENAKTLSRNWVPPPPTDNNLHNTNTQFKEQERGMIETNINQQDKYYNSHEEGEGLEDENNYADQAYTVEASIYTNEITQQNYQADQPLLNPYQANVGYPIYIGGDYTNMEYELDAEVDNKAETTSKEIDIDYGNAVHDLPKQISFSTPLQPTPFSSKKSQKTLQQLPKQGGATQQLMNVLDTVLGGSDWDTNKVDIRSKTRDPKPSGWSYGIPTQFNQQPTPTPPAPETVAVHESKHVTTEEPVTAEFDPEFNQKHLFSRTTTVTKTTTWYLNNDELVFVEEIDGKPQPLKVKYTKSTKTSTTGPIPWYLQDFEDIIFEEENEKSKTILDKMELLKGMSPTAITSFTTAPNPWSSEVNEKVVFEEIFNPKEKINKPETKVHHSTPHSTPLEKIVEYLPRSQELEIKEKKSKKAEVVQFDVEEIVPSIEKVTINETVATKTAINDALDYSLSSNSDSKKSHSKYEQFLPPDHPLLTGIPYFVEDEIVSAKGEPLVQEHYNKKIPHSPNIAQPMVENNFTPHSQVDSHQDLDQNHLPQGSSYHNVDPNHLTQGPDQNHLPQGPPHYGLDTSYPSQTQPYSSDPNYPSQGQPNYGLDLNHLPQTPPHGPDQTHLIQGPSNHGLDPNYMSQTQPYIPDQNHPSQGQPHYTLDPNHLSQTPPYGPDQNQLPQIPPYHGMDSNYVSQPQSYGPDQNHLPQAPPHLNMDPNHQPQTPTHGLEPNQIPQGPPHHGLDPNYLSQTQSYGPDQNHLPQAPPHLTMDPNHLPQTIPHVPDQNHLPQAPPHLTMDPNHQSQSPPHGQDQNLLSQNLPHHGPDPNHLSLTNSPTTPQHNQKIQATEQNHLQQTTSHHIPEQSHIQQPILQIPPKGFNGQHPQALGGYPQQLNKEHSGRGDHQNRENYQGPNIDHQQPPHPPKKMDFLSKDKFFQDDPNKHQQGQQDKYLKLSPQDIKRGLFQNRQPFPNRPKRT